MFSIIGIIIVFVGVFGGYILAGGKMKIIIKAAPFEMMMIGGAAIGAFLIANSTTLLKHMGHALKQIFKGAKYTKQDYIDLLQILFALTRLMKIKGFVVVEGHIENPDESEIFQPYPGIRDDKFAMTLIRDSIRMMTMDMTDPLEMEDIMEKRIEKRKEEELHPAHALTTMADGLPALGIVAAVLGVIKTMGSIDEPPEILGKMIGGALVGTFLGVFLSYGFVGPFGGRVESVVEEEIYFYRVIKEVLIANLRGRAPQICVEIGRGSIPSHLQPDFYEVEEAMDEAPNVTS